MQCRQEYSNLKKLLDRYRMFWVIVRVFTPLFFVHTYIWVCENRVGPVKMRIRTPDAPQYVQNTDFRIPCPIELYSLLCLYFLIREICLDTANIL
jgi:hypothetical protein